jgi:hypothetical protein
MDSISTQNCVVAIFCLIDKKHRDHSHFGLRATATGNENGDTEFQVRDHGFINRGP